MTVLDSALDGTSLVLKKYDPSKVKSVFTSGPPMTPEKFLAEIHKVLGSGIESIPELVSCLIRPDKITELLEEWAEDKNPETPAAGPHPQIVDLTLNLNTAAPSSEKNRFFCTTKEDLREASMHGDTYMALAGISPAEAISVARLVVPKYMPRAAPGIHPTVDPTTLTKVNYFNSYVPASWQLWKLRNQQEWDALPASPPKEIVEMLQHVVPIKEERQYLYAWLSLSITDRAYVYLVLQGKEGVGKNRIKLMFTALHGKHNSMDGKKECFGAGDSKFNGQLFESTGGWFDELKYDADMEARMKEYQNDSASKELKGIDATRNSEVHCSMAISNNHARDNYILFNSRKFVPLVLGKTNLNEVMSPQAIGAFSEKLEEGKSTFDVKYVAQIAKWLLRVGPKYQSNYPGMEYRGPKFWELAHASMSRWQKVAVNALTSRDNRGNIFPGWSHTKQGYKWSEVETALKRKKEFGDRDYRDATTVKTLFDNYRDTEGKKVFETEAIASLIQDFWIKPIVPIAGAQQTPPSLDTESDPTLTRPPGTSQFQWRKMKEAHEAKHGKKGNYNGSETAEEEKNLL